MAKLIVANWKENPRTEKLAEKLFRALLKTKARKALVICPPFIYLEKLAEILRRSKGSTTTLGAQDVFWKEKGPFTSEIGPKMLKALGVRYVIVGHSERRKWLKETDKMINDKVKLALADGLSVILCVGESPAVRKKGTAVARKFVEGQLKKDLAGVKKGEARRVIVAYEPIWAIGTGKNDKPADAAEMADTVKRFLKKSFGFSPRVLYGGSVDNKNAGNYVQYKQIDGALVGGASLHAGKFKKIITVL